MKKGWGLKESFILIFGLYLLVIIAIATVVFFIFINFIFEKKITVLYFSLGILLFFVECYLFFLFFKLILPFHVLVQIFSATAKNSKFKEESSEKVILERLKYLNLLGMFIKELLTHINVEPQTRMLDAEVALFALQSQINPHFLYNTLDTIRNYAMHYNVFEVAEMTEAMGSIFRYSISRPGEVASVEDEINNVKAYLKIQHYRFFDRLDIRWDIDEKDDLIHKYSLPVLTLQPLVENAIQHIMENNLENGVITIRATTTKSKLIISIEDNGLGIDEEKLQEIREKMNTELGTSANPGLRMKGKKTGISLINVHQRLKLYFGEDGGLSVNSIKGFGTSIEIEVPKI